MGIMRTTIIHEMTTTGPGAIRLRAEFRHEGDPSRGFLKFDGLVEAPPDQGARNPDEALDPLLAALRTFLKRSLGLG